MGGKQQAQPVQNLQQPLNTGNQPAFINQTGIAGANTNHHFNQILDANATSPLAFMDKTNSAHFELSTRFNYSQAIVWQIKFIISCFLSKKQLGQASAELQYLSEKFGTDFDKYLIKELVEQIDLKDPSKQQKDKNEAIKSQLLAQELSRMCMRPEFLHYFDEIAQSVFGERYSDFMTELTKRLKLSTKLQLIVALSLAESCPESNQLDCFTILKQKMVEYMQTNKPEPLEDYAVHRLNYICTVYPAFQDNQTFHAHPAQFKEAKAFIFDQTASKQNQSVALRISLGDGDLLSQNPSPDDPSNSLIRNGSEFENLLHVGKILQPWEVLLDLGHYSSYDYQVLTSALQDFKDINEKVMANTILNLSLHHTGQDAYNSRVVLNTFKANKTGEIQALKKEPSEKSATMGWHADAGHFSRAFRENFSNLHWQRVFEAFAELGSDMGVAENIRLDKKAYQTLLQIFNKSKPQNLQVSINVLLDRVWENPALQFSMLKHAVHSYVSNEDRTFNFSKSPRKLPAMADITLAENVPQTFLDVWSQPEVVEILVRLSETAQYVNVRKLFDEPIAKAPEYLILTLSKCNFERGNVLIDELMSNLMPVFLVNQNNSIPVLKRLWDYNQAFMIRGICESCRHEQRIMNLSRVLDITQDIKDSLIKIVYCQDYEFAVNLGILAGKREFLHYDVWLKERIKKVGTPFVKAFISYINEQIIVPCREYMIQNGFANQAKQLTQDEQEQLDQAREQILERSHLSKERLCMTMEHLENPANFQALVNPAQVAENTGLEDQHQIGILVKISAECQIQIKDLVAQYAILFPKQVSPTQSTEEIDKAANEYFQHIFTAEPHQVDERIQELIVTLQNFQKSQVVKEQEIYACVLHGLFDEYRFLHKYPQPYLQKIAKLFGAIIKNKLLNNVLQGIALKFVIEAFRRDGKRLMFGIIVVKEFFECLPDFPKQFQEIYANREKIQQKEPVLYQQLEELYKLHMLDNADNFNPDGDFADDAAPAADKFSADFNFSAEENKASLSDGGDMFDFSKSESDFDQKNLFKPDQIDKGADEAKTKEQTRGKRQQDKAGAGRSKFDKDADAQKDNLNVPANNSNIRADSAEAAMQTNPLAGTLNTESKLFNPRGTPQSAAISSSQDPKKRGKQNINPQSVQFQPQQPAMVPKTSPNISQNSQAPPSLIPMMNIKTKSFRPSDNILSTPQVPQINPQHIAWQKIIDQKIEDAKHNKQQRLRFEDLIEDKALQQPSQEAIDSIKLKCNNTGKNNFKQKLEELKELVTIRPPSTGGRHGKQQEEQTEEQKAEAAINLLWFINYILTKRISGQNQTLHGIYIDLISKLGQKDTVQKTLQQAYQIFQRCMLIDEEEFNKVANKGGGTSQQSSAVKQYLIVLGQFIGSLTLAKNRPIKSTELDLKQLLIQGYQHEQRRSIIAFVSRILKEANKSMIFNRVSNPWVNAILQVMREIYGDTNITLHKDEIRMEIESLFKALNVNNLNDIPVLPIGALSALQINQFNSVQQEVELSYMSQKPNLIPIRQRNQNARNGGLSGDLSYSIDQQIAALQGIDEAEQQDLDAENMSNLQFIYQNVQISESNRNFLKTKFNINDTQITELISKAVEQSIIEILKPVVDRSVTIALITTKELVLKDFAYDTDCDKIIGASEQIVQNLAGSLALVTCREPLRIQLNNFIHKAIKMSCFNVGTTNGLVKSQPFEGMTQKDQEEMQKQDSALNFYIQDNDEQLQDIAQEASKENLELGCKIIKKAVIKQAMVWVKKDPTIIDALERRRKAKDTGETCFVDKDIAQQINDLPAQLQPRKSGLSGDQFKVYADFAKLNSKTKLDHGNFTPGGNSEMYMQFNNGFDRPQVQKEPAVYDFTLDSILARIEKQGKLDSVSRSLMTLKLQDMCKNQNQQSQELFRLWSFVENKFSTICADFDSGVNILPTVEILCLIVKKYTLDNFARKLLIEIFFEMEDMYIFNVDLHILLIKQRVFSIAEWEEQLASFIMRPASGEKDLNFLSEIVQRAVFTEKFMTEAQIPHLMTALENLERGNKTDTTSIIARNTLKKLKGLIPSDQEENLRKLYIKWVELSQIDDASAEEGMNKYFEQLSQLGIDKDQELLFTFCNVMVKESIELALCTSMGQRRLNNNTLDYRFVDSLTKLILCLLSCFDKLNKVQFMSKIFEFIKQKLDLDHNTQQDVFNQKPYYRLLMNILRAVTAASECFNQKVQRQILFDLADLLQDLNPNNYPAFAFAWLELVSHKLFMPHFIKMQAQQGQPGKDSDGQLFDANTLHITQAQLVKQENSVTFQKLQKIKDLLVSCFTFIKHNLLPGSKASPAMRSFYTATMNIVLVILKDYPQFLCDFHFNFVNALPDHAIQLKNMILAAFPKSIQPPNPFSQDLKVDTMLDVRDPRILSNFEGHLTKNGLKQDLENYFNSRDPILINQICIKMMQSKDRLNGRVVTDSAVINAVVLFIAQRTCDDKNNASEPQQNEKENIDLFKEITVQLNEDTRLCFMNSIINELRYPNSHTYFFCLILLRLFVESKPNIQEQISTILFERLQALRPYPWGLMINFRELIQNTKYGFMKSPFIAENQDAIQNLFKTKDRLRPFFQFIQQQKQQHIQQMQPGFQVPIQYQQPNQFAGQHMNVNDMQNMGHQTQFRQQPGNHF